MEKNYSKKIRNMYETILKSLPILHDDENFKHYGIIFSLTEIEDMADKNEEIYFFRYSKLIIMILKLQMYTDLYKKLNLINKIDCMDENEEFNLNKLKSIYNYDHLSEYFNTGLYQTELSQSIIEFNDLSAYDKILQIKALDKTDIDKLKKFNPFFEEEYNKYNVKINDEFIDRQINKWKKSFPNDEDLVKLKISEFVYLLKSVSEKEYFYLLDTMGYKLSSKEKKELSSNDIIDIVNEYYFNNKKLIKINGEMNNDK